MPHHPKNFAEYTERTNINTRITGQGIGNVYTHQPCFFCGAPDFMCYEIMQVEKVMSEGATCKECGRSCKAIFKHDRGSTAFEVVQTGGPEQPDYFTHKMRRVDS